MLSSVLFNRITFWVLFSPLAGDSNLPLLFTRIRYCQNFTERTVVLWTLFLNGGKKNFFCLAVNISLFTLFISVNLGSNPLRIVKGTEDSPEKAFPTHPLSWHYHTDAKQDHLIRIQLLLLLFASERFAPIHWKPLNPTLTWKTIQTRICFFSRQKMSSWHITRP